MHFSLLLFFAKRAFRDNDAATSRCLPRGALFCCLARLSLLTITALRGTLCLSR